MTDEYNRQPYDAQGRDTTGPRNMPWFYNRAANLLKLMVGRHTNILDVGCGNGRLFPFLKTISTNVYGIDPVETPNQKYMDDVSFTQCGLDEYDPGVEFGAILFFGSFKVMSVSGVDIRGNCDRLLCKSPRIFPATVAVIIDGCDVDLVREQFPNATAHHIDEQTRLMVSNS